MLKDFLKINKIDLKALERLRHRVFIVGRFNDKSTGEFPQVFLFKHPNRIISKAYQDNFTDVGELDYTSFVKALGPTISEVIEDTQQKGKLKKVSIVPPGQEVGPSSKKAKGAYVLNEHNWFFLRAVAASDQGAFETSRPSLPRELLSEGSEQPGRDIFRLIRNNLASFAQFQPRTFELVEALSDLLGGCGEQNGLPAYPAGGRLPPGLPEMLIDFLYAEDTRMPFSLEGVDLSEDRWEELKKSDTAQKTFSAIVTAFRDELLESSKKQFHHLRFRGRSLNDKARDVLPEDLRKEFLVARDAYNGLRQILRGKVLLSMVLDWVLKAYYDIPDVKALGNAKAAQKDKAVERAILTNWKRNGLAEPVKRPSKSERKRFSKELRQNFESLLKAVLADEPKRAAWLGELPEQVRELAQEIIGNPKLVEILKGLSNPSFGAEYQQSFIDAAKVLLADVLCPTLFQDPILTERTLRRFFRKEMMTTYLMAVFLDNRSQEAVRQIGEEHLKLFQSKIDDRSQTIRDSAELQRLLLKDFVNVLTRPELQRRLDEAGRVLSEAYTILENTPMQLSQGRSFGASKVTPIAPDPSYHKSEAVLQTDVKIDDITPAIERIAEPIAYKKIEQRVATASASRAAAAAGGSGGADQSKDSPPRGTSSTESTGAAGSGQEDEVDDQPISRLEGSIAADIDAILTHVDDDVFETEDGSGIPPDMIQEKAGSIAKTAVSNIIARHRDSTTADSAHDNQPDILAAMKKDLRAFQQALFLIYQRYNENSEKTMFTNNVDRLTLVNLMLLFQKELGLGDVQSNLLHLLLDLVLHLDPKNPDPKDFLAERSLTIYFDNAMLENGGITSLRQVLEAQADENLRSTVAFVSELQGIKYLFDSVYKDKEAEVVVVNATADEFKHWLTADNLSTPKGALARLNSNKFVTNASDGAIHPGLVYLTDAAFAGSSKESFLEDLANFPLSSQQTSILLPPLCLSTPIQSDDWEAVGAKLADKAIAVPGPVVIVGPSSFMNRESDAFKTYLPAGYPFAAHFLCHPEQKIKNPLVKVQGSGRFCSIAYSETEMKESLDRVLWGRDNQDTYAFGVDFYLYIVLNILATGFRRGGALANQGDWYAYFNDFYYTPSVMSKTAYAQAAKIIKDLLPGGEEEAFAMEQDLSTPGQTLDSVALRPPGRKDLTLHITDVKWFDHARRAAGLPM